MAKEVEQWAQCPWISLILPHAPLPESSWFDTTVRGPAEGLVLTPAGDITLEVALLTCKLRYTFSQWPMYGVFFFLTRMHRPQNRRLELEVVSLTITWYTWRVFAFCPCDLGLCGFEDPSAQGNKAKNGAIVLTEVIDPHYQGEIVLLLQEDGRELCEEHRGFAGCLLLLLNCPIILVNGEW